MGNLFSHQIGMAKESTYGTAVTPTRFYPYLDGSSHSWDNRRRQGMGTYAGVRTVLASRSFLPKGQGTVTIKAELESKAAGVLLDAGLGHSVVTTITGGSQQLFDPDITSGVLNSYTIQFGTAQNSGTVDTYTYYGCSATKCTIESPEDGIVTAEVEFDALGFTTATGLAAATYASGGAIFDASQAVAGLGGTLTVPSTTAIATGLTSYPDIRSWKIEVNQNADTSRWVQSTAGRSQPTVGLVEATWSAQVEYNSTTWSGAMSAGTTFPWYSTYTTTETLGAATTQLQVVCPKLLPTKGFPAPKPGETVVMDTEATVANDGTNKTFYVVYRTTDTAL